MINIIIEEEDEVEKVWKWNKWFDIFFRAFIWARKHSEKEMTPSILWVKLHHWNKDFFNRT